MDGAKPGVDKNARCLDGQRRSCLGEVVRRGKIRNGRFLSSLGRHCAVRRRRKSGGPTLLAVALDVEAATQVELVAARLAQVVGDHLADELVEADRRRPAKVLARL